VQIPQVYAISLRHKFTQQVYATSLRNKFTQQVYATSLRNRSWNLTVRTLEELTLSRTESIYPPNLVDNKKIQQTYFVSINDNKINTVYKKCYQILFFVCA